MRTAEAVAIGGRRAPNEGRPLPWAEAPRWLAVWRRNRPYRSKLPRKPISQELWKGCTISVERNFLAERVNVPASSRRPCPPCAELHAGEPMGGRRSFFIRDEEAVLVVALW
jgi:hypothetical protein